MIGLHSSRPDTRRRIALAAVLVCLQAPVHAATLHRGLGPEPDSLHIHRAQGLAAINVLRDIREGLVTYGPDGEPIPGGAASWTVSEDGLTWRFRLRTDARWSNGDAVVAADYVRGWQAGLAPASAGAAASLLAPVRNAVAVMSGDQPPESLGIRAIGDGELEISLAAPAPWLPEILAHPVAYPLHPQAMDDPRRNPVNGSFVLADWSPQARLLLERNEAHYGAAEVRLDSVIYFPIEEPSAELSRFRSGELDITETIPTGRFKWLRENLPRALRIHPYLGSFWLGFNLRKPHLADTALRKALALAIDRETLVRVVLGSGEVPAWGIVPPGLDGYPGGALDYAGLAKEARIEAAREYLAASVYDPAEPLVLEIRYNTSSLHRRVMVAVAAMWKQSLGISAELVNEEWKVFVNNRRLGVVTEVFRGGWIADFADPTTFLDLFHGGSQLNTTFYANPEYDRLLRDASTMRGAARMEALAAAEARLMDDMPVIPLYYYVSRHLVSERTQGFIDNVRDIHLSRYLDVEPLRDGG